MRCLYKDRITCFHIRIQMSQKTVSVRFFNDGKLRIHSRFLRNICRKGSGTDANVNSALSGMLANFLVKRNLILPKLAHVSKDCHSSACAVLQNVQRSFHGHRVGVVAVIHDQETVCLDHMESAADGFQSLNSMADLLQGKSVDSSHCSGCQSIVHHVTSRHWNIGHKGLSSHMNTAGHTFQASAYNFVCINIFIRFHAEEYRLDALIFLNRAKLVVITVQHNVTIFFQVFENLGFCFQDTVSVAQIFQMAGTDVCDHAGIRSCNLCQTGHLTEITDSHFQNCNLILITKTENSEGKSQLIVEISLGFQGTVFLLQNGRDHFLGAGLANASCDSHYRDLKLLQIKFRNVLHCLKGRFHFNVWEICVLQRALGQSGKCPCFHYLRNKFMRIHTLSHNWNKKRSCFYFSAVRCDGGNFLVQLVSRAEVNAAADFGYIFKSQIFHFKFFLTL